MKKNLLAGIMALMMCFSPVASFAASSWEAGPKESKAPHYKEGEAIVLFEDSQSSMSRRAAAASLDADDIQVTDICNFKHADKEEAPQGSSASRKSTEQKTTAIALVRSEKLSTEKLLEKLKASGQVEVAAPNYQVKACEMPGDPYAQYQWSLENTGQSGGVPGADLHPERLWDKGTTGSSKVVAVIDSGVDYTHEDLRSNMWVNPHQDKLPGKYGYNFANGDADPMDKQGHGTNCAGIIGAAGDNGIGISGINQKIKIMALKFLDSNGYGESYDALRAYEYISAAQDLGVEITAINNSYRWYVENDVSEAAAGIRDASQIFKEAIDITGEKGAISFCGAGNESIDNDRIAIIPAGTDSPYNVAVAASDSAGNLAPYSNYGKTSVDLAAPGSDILLPSIADSFNPSIYSPKQREELCSAFADYEESDLEKITWGRPKALTGGTMNLDKENFFNTGKQSLKFILTADRPDVVYTFDIPYTLKPTNEDTYASLAIMGSPAADGEPIAIGIWESGKDESLSTTEKMPDAIATGNNTWNYLSLKTNAKRSNEEQERRLTIGLNVRKAGVYTLNLDQLGISKENVSAAKFGKYTFASGTSLAAPHAAGAAALIAADNPGLSALEVAEAVKKSVRKTDSMAGKVASGGVLDLTTLSIPQAISSVTLNKTSAKVKKGAAFTLKAMVSPQNASEKGVTWKTSNSKAATVDQKGRVVAKDYGKAYITAVSKDRGGKSARCAVTTCYSIRYKTGGGRLAKNSPDLYYNEKVSLKKPARAGYSFRGWYTDKGLKHKITAIKKGAEKNYTLYAKWSKIKVGKTYIKRISKKRSTKMRLSYKKVSGADGYQIKYSRSKSFKKSSYANAKSAKKTIKGLKKDSRYYVKIRAYKYDSAGKKIYGKYSAAVRIR